MPSARNIARKPECRKASKAASQKRWLAKPENQGYFCGPKNVKRVQLWREANPGYWRGKRKTTKDALQDPLNRQPIENNTDNVEFAQRCVARFLNRTTACFTWINRQFYRKCVAR